MRLNKYLALCGVDSRRKCDTLILKKKIKVNGKVVGDFSYRVQKDDLVQYKNSVVSPQDDYKFYLINKPSGYVCSSSPSDGKRVIDLIPSKRRLFTIGRLDRDTTGAIIVTDNGDVANKFMHPKYKIEKIYIAESKMDIDRKIYGNLINGISIGSGQIAKGKMTRLHKENGIIFWEIILTEGKNREIKRLFKSMGSELTKLHRYSIAGFNVKNIKIGHYRSLNIKQIQKLI